MVDKVLLVVERPVLTEARVEFLVVAGEAAAPGITLEPASISMEPMEGPAVFLPVEAAVGVVVVVLAPTPDQVAAEVLERGEAAREATAGRAGQREPGEPPALEGAMEV